MILNYQELILDKYRSYEAIRDCFAIQRLQAEIKNLYLYLSVHPDNGAHIDNLTAELRHILLKYPNAIDAAKLL